MKAFIIGVSIISILAAVVPILVGRQTFDGLADDHPYERGLRWDAEQREKADTGWSVLLRADDIRQGDNIIVFALRDREGRPIAAERVSVGISRPSSSAYDRFYESRPLGDGRYEAAVHLPLRGRWDLRITVTKDKRTVTLDQKIHADSPG